MHKNEPKSVGTTDTPGNKFLADNEAMLTAMHFLDKYLGNDVRSMLAFSQTCKVAQRMSYEALLKSLLSAVVCGDEILAKQIVTAHPKLLLDASASVIDLSGKKIKGLTPLQAARCAGDVEMAQMLIQILRLNSANLKIYPEAEIQRQFKAAIHPYENIDLVEATQKIQAQEFKTTKLRAIFNIINAPDADVAFELKTPGQHRDSALNNALHTFRENFASTSNNEQIFNPYYLLSAFEFHVENFYNFTDINCRYLFWRQIIGYMQRHLPACYLQAFARSIYDIVKHGAKLERTFECHYWKGHYMKPDVDGLNNLGYKWDGVCRWVWLGRRGEGATADFSKFIANKKIRFGELTQPESQWQQLQSYLPTRMRNRVRYPCCSIS